MLVAPKEIGVTKKKHSMLYPIAAKNMFHKVV